MGPALELDGAAAVVTGAGSGIGRAAAIAFAGRGARVVVSDVDGERANGVAAEITASGGRAIAIRIDVTDTAQLEVLRAACIGAFGSVDLVMNNVGVIAMGPPESLPVAEWQRVLDVNLLSVVRSNLVFLPGLLEQGRGHVVNTASVSGLLAHGFDRMPYVASKHALVGVTEAMAHYLWPRGIGVTCVCPSGVATNIVEQITFFGEPATPRSPDHPIVEPDVVGELVADAVGEGRFLVLTVPEVRDDLVARAQDLDAYLAQQVDG